MTIPTTEDAEDRRKNPAASPSTKLGMLTKLGMP
jgi:hypothetical protein